jgi:hypothetical protein
MEKKIREEVFKNSPDMQAWKKVILFLPVVMSVSFIFYLQISSQQPYYGMELLAPVDTAPFMIALIIFTVGYVIFLLMMFSENIKEFLASKAKH